MNARFALQGPDGSRHARYVLRSKVERLSPLQVAA
jgi:hypothetical protein